MKDYLYKITSEGSDTFLMVRNAESETEASKRALAIVHESKQSVDKTELYVSGIDLEFGKGFGGYDFES